MLLTVTLPFFIKKTKNTMPLCALLKACPVLGPTFDLCKYLFLFECKCQAKGRTEHRVLGQKAVILDMSG